MLRYARSILLACVLFTSCISGPTTAPHPATRTIPRAASSAYAVMPTSSPGLAMTTTPAPTETRAPDSTSTPVPTPVATSTPVLTRTPAPSLRLRILSYNLLYGAGVERQFDSALPKNLAGASRLPQLLLYAKAANPDIWGIQEANGWERGTPPWIDRVARELGMNRVLARTPGGFHVALLTRLPVLESADLSPDIGRQGVLRAMVRTSDGGLVHLFVAHLEPNASDARLCEVNWLLQQMQPYANQRTLLFGDLNFTRVSREYAQLEQAGWKPVAVESAWGIDQVWASPSVKWSTTSWFDSLPRPGNISDHNPIGAEINLYSAAAPTRTIVPFTPTRALSSTLALTRTVVAPALSPVPTLALPTLLPEVLSGARVQRREEFDNPCAATRWTSRWKTERIANGALEITGESPWLANVTRYRQFARGEGVLFRLQFARGSEFETGLENAAWNTDLYRRFGMNLREDAAQGVVWQGTNGSRGENLSGNLYPKPETWYYLLLALDKKGEFTIRMWDPADPQQKLEYRGAVGEANGDFPWTLSVGADKGKLLIDSVTEFALNRPITP